MTQNDVFLNGEADEWFRRNKEFLTEIGSGERAEDVQYICRTLSPFKDRISCVLEVGCSNGIKLEAICTSLDALAFGVDPSPAAIEAGQRREKSIDLALTVGTGDRLEFKTEQFDVVYFGFCLYLFDRETLLQSLSEADRVLKRGGFLVITDFDPGFRCRTPYKHKQGVYSFKQDYSAFYVQTGLYYLLGKHSFSHRADYFDVVADERVSTAILYKEVSSYPSSV